MRQNSWLAIAIALFAVLLGFSVLNERNGVLGGIVGQDEGTFVAIRPIWNFTGTGVTLTEDEANNRITVDVPAAAGASAFTDLSDVPASYTGESGRYVKVNATEDGLEFDTPAGAGDITAIGDVADGEAFTSDGTAGTSLYFYDAEGRGQLTIANLTEARTYTLPDATGEVSLLGQTVALTTETSGNYVADVGAGTGIDVTGTPGEGWTATVAVDSDVTMDADIDTQGEVETIWGTTLATDSELAAKPSLVSAGSNGTAAANAGDDTTAARSDHEHYYYRDIAWSYPDTLATGDSGQWVRIAQAGASGDIIAAYAVLGTAGSTSTTVDILTCSQTDVDGTPSWTTIFTNKLLIDANERSTNTGSTAPSLNVTSWTANDHFRINIDSAGTDAADLTVILTIRCKDKAS